MGSKSEVVIFDNEFVFMKRFILSVSGFITIKGKNALKRHRSKNIIKRRQTILRNAFLKAVCET